MTQPFFPEGVNTFGIIAFWMFLLCWLGAALSAWAMFRAGDAQHFQSAFSVWTQPEPRKRFLRFLAFCLCGVLCGIAAMAFGGWAGPHQ